MNRWARFTLVFMLAVVTGIMLGTRLRQRAQTARTCQAEAAAVGAALTGMRNNASAGHPIEQQVVAEAETVQKRAEQCQAAGGTHCLTHQMWARHHELAARADSYRTKGAELLDKYQQAQSRLIVCEKAAMLNGKERSEG